MRPDPSVDLFMTWMKQVLAGYTPSEMWTDVTSITKFPKCGMISATQFSKLNVTTIERCPCLKSLSP